MPRWTKRNDFLTRPLRRLTEAIPVKICPVAPDVILPKLATSGSSGYDLYSYPPKGTLWIEPQRSFILRTGFALEISEGYEAQVRPRSGLAAKCIMGNLGTIDADYRGELKVLLYNYGREPVAVDLSKAVGQLVFARVYHPKFRLVPALKPTKRGTGGFGSTDKKE
jgi:dUTP pyrophosphatase